METSKPRREDGSKVRIVYTEVMDDAPGEGCEANRESRDRPERMKTEFWDRLTFLRRKEMIKR